MHSLTTVSEPGAPSTARSPRTLGCDSDLWIDTSRSARAWIRPRPAPPSSKHHRRSLAFGTSACSHRSRRRVADPLANSAVPPLTARFAVALVLFEAAIALSHELQFRSLSFQFSYFLFSVF
jgi:hypothetical protein